MSRIPQTIGRFEIESLLGSGSMGEVYKAWDPTLERFIALKVIHSSVTVQERVRERFMREAKAASKLRHPSIVTVYDLGEFNGQLFLVMEFVPGEDLQKVIDRRQPLSHDIKLDIMRQLAEGVGSAHSNGVIHRDLKPSNILLDHDKRIKIVDFGLARIDTSEITAAGTILGTPNYMSPEQVQGITVDERSDIFALGAIFYELFSGMKAFPGHDFVAVLYKIISENPPPLAQFLSGNVEELEQIIRKCLEKDRANRLSGCSELSRLIHQISAPDMSNLVTVDLSPVISRAVEAVPNNLPPRKYPLIGRDQELAALRSLFVDRNLELVTLTGPGGSGKTKLALEAARELTAYFPSGVYFVSLESIHDPQLVISSLFQTLSAPEISGTDLIENLIRHLREVNRKGMLLVLDNFEQVMDAARDVHLLLSRRTGVKFLITSRERLNISEEHEFPVRPLLVPQKQDPPVLDKVLQNPAIQLFQERAKVTRPDFRIGFDNASAILEICRKLDGLPLAIELVAARIKFLSPDEILRKLESSLSILGSGPKDLPDRLRSLEGAISWSYELLAEDSRKLFQRLSVFRGPFLLEAVDAVGLDAVSDSLEELMSLADKNLLIIEQVSGQSRFIMLNTLREFALSRLKEKEEYPEIRNRHADYYLHLAERLSVKLDASEDEQTLREFDLSHDNFRSALEWLVESEKWDEAAHLALALWKFWDLRSHRSEGKQWLSLLVQQGEEQLSIRLKTRILYAAGVLSEAQGDYPAARKFFEENLEINRRLEDAPGIANSLNNVAVMAERQGDMLTAQSLYTEALERWKQLGNRVACALGFVNLGSIAATQRDHSRAQEMYEQSLYIWNEINDVRGKGLVLNLMGDLARDQNNLENAFQLYQEGLSYFERIADQRGIALSLQNLGLLLCEDRDFDQAVALFSEALAIQQNLGDKRGLAKAVECFAVLKTGEGDYAGAAALGGASTRLRESIGAARTPAEKQLFDRTIESARAGAGHLKFTQHWLRGMTLAVDQVVREALGHDSPDGIMKKTLE